MNIFTNKKIWKKIAIILVIIILFQAIATNPAIAADDDVLESGGKLLKPIFSLLVTIGDAVMGLLHSSIMNVDEVLIRVDTDGPWWDLIKDIVAVIVTAACIIGAIILTGGIATILAWTAVISVASTVLLGSNFIVDLENQAGYGVMSMFDKDALPSELYLPAYSYSPEEIFKGNILLFNVDFFRKPIEIKEKRTEPDEEGNTKISYYYYEDENGNEVVTSNQDSAEFLRGTISSWYVTIRDICLVLMLSILVYIGIRILLASVASDKAKYRTMLKDWFIGLCLLFLMHYIMAFSVAIVQKVTQVVSATIDNNKYMNHIPYDEDIQESLVDLLGEDKEESLRADPEDEKQGWIWPSNLMGYLRLKAQMNSHGWQYIGEAVIFLTLVVFTVMFTFVYFRRLLHMAFLTILAPLVALTYCIDKLNDGQAQGFNKWFKEYIFNLLIQPVHLILYYILITSSFELMGKNLIYSMVAIVFLLPAEKLLRSLFGFEKAQTAPALGPAGAMMATSMVSNLLKKPRGGGKGEGKDSDSEIKPPSPPERDALSGFLDEENNPSSSSSQTQEESTPQQQMMDSYEEGFGGEDFDPVEYNAMAEEANGNSDDMQYSNEDYENIARDTLGEDATEEEIQDFMRDNFGIEPSQQEETAESNATTESSPTAGSGSTVRSSSTSSNQRPRRIKGIARRVGRRAHAYKAVGKAAVRDLPRKAIRTVGKVGAGVAVGSLAAGASVAAAMATGDFANVVKAGTASAATGFAVGSGIVRQGISMKSELKEAYDQAYNNTEYKEDARSDYVKKYLKSQKNQAVFEEAFGKTKAKEMMRKGGEIEQYIRNGITDTKEMKALHKLQDGKDKMVNSTEQAITVAKLAKMIGTDSNDMTTKKRNEWKTRIGDMAKNSGIKDTSKFATDRLKEIDKFNDLKNR